MESKSHPGSSTMNVLWRIILFVSFSVAIAAAMNARAQESAPPAAPASPAAKEGSKDPKKNVVNFEDQLVEGQTQKPELFYLLQQKNANFKRLIRLRENFIPEMKSTAEEIGRSGRGARGSNQGT